MLGRTLGESFRGPLQGIADILDSIKAGLKAIQHALAIRKRGPAAIAPLLRMEDIKQRWLIVAGFGLAWCGVIALSGILERVFRLEVDVTGSEIRFFYTAEIAVLLVLASLFQKPRHTVACLFFLLVVYGFHRQPLWVWALVDVVVWIASAALLLSFVILFNKNKVELKWDQTEEPYYTNLGAGYPVRVYLHDLEDEED